LDFAKRLVDVVRVGDVRLHGERLATRMLDGFDGSARAIGVGRITERDRMAGGGERENGLATYTAGAACHEGDAIGCGHRAPQRTSALAHVMPAPKPEHSTRSPS